MPSQSVLSSNFPSLLTSAISRLPFSLPSAASPSSPSPRSQRADSARQVASAQRYMQLRKAGRVEELLRLVSDDVVLESSRDGRHAGRDGLERYVRRVKPVGRWEKAAWNEEMGRAEIKGLVKILVVSVNVTAHFGFDRRGKINQIYVGTRKGKGRER